MTVLSSYAKTSLEKKRYTLDYACWLDDGESLADFAIVVSPSTAPPLIASGAYGNAEANRITVYLSQGMPGGLYTVSFIATTTQGQVKQDDLKMRVT